MQYFTIIVICRLFLIKSGPITFTGEGVSKGVKRNLRAQSFQSIDFYHAIFSDYKDNVKTN